MFLACSRSAAAMPKRMTHATSSNIGPQSMSCCTRCGVATSPGNRANKQLTIRVAVPGCKQHKLKSRSLSTRRRRSAILRRVSAEPKKAHRERYRRCRRCTAPCAKRTDRRKRFATSSPPSKNSGNELQPANRQIKINLSERPASKVARNCCTATIRDTSGFKVQQGRLPQWVGAP